MSDMAILWVILAGLMEPIWMVSLQRYNKSKNLLWGAVVVAFMFIGPACLSMATEGNLPVSIAYAVWVSIGTVMTTLTGWLLYKDPIDRYTIFYIALVVVGVAGFDLVVG